MFLCVYPCLSVVYPNPLQSGIAKDIFFYGVIRMIQLEHVSKWSLTDVNMHIPQGEIVGLTGASGAGKTTFIKLVCGLLKPSEGIVRTMGKDPVLYRRSYGRDLGAYITGIPLLDGNDTVEGNFRSLMYIYRIPKGEYQQEYRRLSERLGFHSLSGEKVKDLSLGQRVRAELGAALLHRPRLLLLDEPTVGLDENGKQALGGLLKERRGQGMTVLISSHDMAVISGLCSRIAVLMDGHLAFYGSMGRLCSRYAPADKLTVRISGRFPDLDDLPLKGYSVENDLLTLYYNSDHITAAEILKLILGQTRIEEVHMHRPGLEDIITQRKREG